MNTKDSRYIAAEKKIKRAFYDILSRKSIDRIRTQEIIEAAGINKSTFYSHYRDKYDLLTSIGSDTADILYPALVKIFTGMLSDEPDSNVEGEALQYLSEIFTQYERYFRVVMRDLSGAMFASQLSDRIEEIWLTQGIADPSEIYYSYLINAITYILIGTIEKWVRRDCADPHSELKRLAKDVSLGVRNALRSAANI